MIYKEFSLLENYEDFLYVILWFRSSTLVQNFKVFYRLVIG